MVGTVLDGRYRVLAKLAVGGFGEIYLVEHLLFQRQEALKVLRRELAADVTLVQRFSREARIVSRLKHPHIVGLHDVGQLGDGRLYFSMEYAFGPTLSDLIQGQGPLGVSRSLPILAQLVQAVAHAHAADVVHRDLKPANLVLTEHLGHRDYLKVLDFGLGKILSDDSGRSRVTVDGEVFGTPAYMAPEQGLGIEVDARTDLYAIGCIAFELVTGEPPFAGGPRELMVKQAQEAPATPSRANPAGGIPPELDRLILRCLEKDPGRRFAGAAELLAALDEVPRPGPSSPLDRGQSQKSTLLDMAGHAEHLTAEEIDAVIRDILHEMAGVLVELGCAPPAVATSVAECQRLQVKLAQIDQELAAVESDLDAAEQQARERTGPLRFAVGELRFERTQLVLRGAPSGDLEYQIQELERNLTTVDRTCRAEREPLLGRFAHLTGVRTRVSERFEELVRGVQPEVEEIAKANAEHRFVVSLLGKMDETRRRKRRG